MLPQTRKRRIISRRHPRLSRSEVDINELYKQVMSDEPNAEERLFSELRARFKVFLQLRIVDEQAREDLVQDTLATVAAKYRRDETKRSFAAWAYTILENKLRDFYRSQKSERSRRQRLTESAVLPQTSNPNPALRTRLLLCLAELCRAHTRYARVLIRIYQGFSIEEICRQLNLERNNCYVLLYRARSRLRECLRRGGIDV
jgi:RNA polymerase sigma-70 factor (ECF subfamily)